MANPENQRNTRLNVRLAPDMLERVGRVAERLGLAPATVGAIAVAEFVNRKDSERELMEMIAKTQGAAALQALERVFADPEALARMASAVEAAEHNAEPRLPGV